MQLLWPLIIRVGFVLLGVVVLAYVIRRLLKHWERWAAEQRLIERCPCGYPLQGLALARCPECGRVIGFDAEAAGRGEPRGRMTRRARAWHSAGTVVGLWCETPPPAFSSTP